MRPALFARREGESLRASARPRAFLQLGRGGTAAGGHQSGNPTGMVGRPVARIAGGGVEAIAAADELGPANARIGHPQLDAVLLRVQKRKVRAVRREMHVRKICLRWDSDLNLAIVGNLLERDRENVGG